MKRIVYLAAALLLACCSRETLPETNEIEIVETPEPKTYTVSLRATIAPETRLSFDTSTGEGVWDSSDQVALFTSNGELIVGVIKDGDFNDGVSPTFTFTIQDGDKIEDGTTVYYPASIAVAGNQNQIVLPASFDDFDVMKKSIPMKATVSGKTMAFQHLASMVYVAPFTTTPSYPGQGMGPQFVKFSVSGNNPITGTFTVNNDLSLTPVGSNGTMTITAPWALNKSYYFVLPAATYADGFSLSITSGVHNEQDNVRFTFCKKTRSSEFTAQRASMLRMPTFDPQCKEFYLTSTETDWSDDVTLARMIQTGENSFLGALYSHQGPNGNRDLGLRILQRYNLGTHTQNTIAATNSTFTPGKVFGDASFGKDTGNFDGSQNGAGVYKVSITLGANSWTYTSEWVDKEWNLEWENGNKRTLKLVGNFDGWEQGGIQLNQIVGHNWTAEVEVSETAKIKPGQPYEWKIKRDDGWNVNWGQGTITETQLSSFIQIKDSEHTNPGNGTLNLPAGTYNIYFNDAIGWIMFEKK